jgi:4-alpha-glucanotransferase
MPRKASNPHRDLYDLARFHGVQISYRDAFGQYQFVNPEALLGIVRALNLPLEKPDDAGSLLTQSRIERWDDHLPPTTVAWIGEQNSIPLRTADVSAGVLHCSITLEGGGETAWDTTLEALPVSGSQRLGDKTYVERRVELPELPVGYHQLALEFGKHRWQCLVISAPVRAYEPKGTFRGYFAPGYALHDERSWGAGDVTDLSRFAAWVDRRGGDFVATLPLLPAYLETDHFSPSPYSPVSRLFWNELYIDPVEAARTQGNTKALDWYGSGSTQAELSRLQKTPVIDYQGTWRLKRKMLEMLELDAEPAPHVVEYARFRAVREKQRRPWREWQERLRNGDIRDGNYDAAVFRFYATSQRIIGEQLAAFSKTLSSRGQQVYLDLPIGSDADGFDAWKHQKLFAHSVQCGAPPDLLFTAGQAWGLPPMIPEEMRRSGYEHLRAVIRHHLSLADILRYDHVIGLHRLYWVPDGFSARQGIFVQYPADELYAILSIESHRAQSVVVGENLGTVPKRINAAMARHGIYETYVMQYEIPLDPARSIRLPPQRSLAGLNTHDMPTFMGFLEGKDLKIQGNLGLRDDESLRQALSERALQVEVLCKDLERRSLLEPGDRDPKHIFEACTAMLSGSRAQYVSTNVEDLWQETEGHNIPGTATGNWQRRLARAIEELPGPG